VSLPGTVWLRDRVETAQAFGGGNQRNMGSPMLSGAAFAMSAVFVAAWVVGRGVWADAGLGRRSAPSPRFVGVIDVPLGARRRAGTKPGNYDAICVSEASVGGLRRYW
jgi:hypothetical protein